jgi:hypothetical protein
MDFLSDKFGMKKSSLLFSSLILFSSCSHHATRHPASSPLSPPKITNFLEDSNQIIADVEDHAFPDLCVSYLKQLEKNIDEMDIKAFPLAQVKHDAEAITKNSWQIRSILHSRLSEFDKACAIQAQANFRQLRFVEDYLLEISRNVTPMHPSEVKFQEQSIPVMDITVPYYELKLNSQVKFEPGDLLVTRGVSFMSAMIARLGKRPSQFSHVAMVYEDPKTHAMKTIESYVGVGAAFYDMDFALKNENTRILWLRAKDRNLARKASEKMQAVVQTSIDTKQTIKYDYELNFGDASSMSCAEVSQVAYKMADPTFAIPYYPNELSSTNGVIDRLKITPGETYEPGDMEIDPRFELIGEFQDLRITRDSRRKDAILSALFDWMENKNYELHDSMKSKMAGGIIYTLRRTFAWPLVKLILSLDDFSKEIPRNMLSTVKLVDELGSEILVELEKRDIEFEKKNGVPMTYMDFYKELEEMRVKDLELYNNKETRSSSKFHKYIRPRTK